MPEPKKRTTKRRTGNRRQHLIAKLAREVNRRSPVKVRPPQKVKKTETKATTKTKPASQKTKGEADGR